MGGSTNTKGRNRCSGEDMYFSNILIFDAQNDFKNVIFIICADCSGTARFYVTTTIYDGYEC